MTAVALGLGMAKHAHAQISIVENSSTNWTISNGPLKVTFDPAKSNITDFQVNGGPNILDPNDSQLYPEFAGTPFGSGTMTATYQATTNYIDFSTTTQSTGTSTNPVTYSFHYILFAGDPAIHMYEVVNHSATDPATSVGQGQFLMRLNTSDFSTLYQSNVSLNNPGATVTQVPTTAAQLAEVGGPNGYGNPATIVPPQTTAINQRQDLAEVLDLNGDTDIEQLLGRNFINKYDYSSYEQFRQGQTDFGPNYTVSTVGMSEDTMTGGPTKQNLQFTLTGSDDDTSDPSGAFQNILMQEFLSGHYGDGNYSYIPPQGVASSRLFGPYVFRAVPTDGETAAQQYQNAINSAYDYPSLYATDTTLLANDYVPDTARGSLSINLANSAGWSSNIDNNTIVLSDPNTNFQESHQGYQYWTQISSTGSATINNIVPGTYRMSIYEGGQWGETRVDGVQVKDNQVTLPLGVKFTPENFGTAPPIWTIGTPNRSANEFLNGHNASGGDNRNYSGSYNYWAEMNYPNAPQNDGKVVYYATAVGSTPATNNSNAWIANQWGSFDPALYDPANNTQDLYSTEVPAYVNNYIAAHPGTTLANYGGSPWEVHFATTQAQINQGQYVVLSVGLAANEGSLIVELNGHQEIWHYGGTNSDPMVRSGVAGRYEMLAFQFPTTDLLAAGPNNNNEFTFSVSQSEGVMYDALRMEITNTSASPATTGWNDYAYITGSNTQSGPVDSIGLSATQSFQQQAPSMTWNNAGASGDGMTWDTSSPNWNNGTSPAVYADGDPITLNDTNNGNYAITLNNTVAPASLVVNNSAGNYTISGSGGISGPMSLVKVGSSKLTLNTVNTYTGGTQVNGGTLVVGVNGALPNGNVSVSSVGNLTLGANTGTTTVQSVAIAQGGAVDLMNNALIIQYGSPAADPVSTVHLDLVAAYAAKYAAAGLPITSSVAASNPGAFAIGYSDNTPTNQLKIMVTVPGDANLDGQTDFNDLTIVAQFFGQTVTTNPTLGWSNGDENYDGQVDFNDLTLVAQYFGDSLTKAEAAALPASFVAQYNLALAEIHASSVPEPTAATLLIAASVGMLGRRRAKK